MPAGVARRARLGVQLRLEAAGALPGPGEALQPPEEAVSQARQAGRAERRGLGHHRAFDRDVQGIGQGLQQPVVGDHAAVDPQRVQLPGAVGRHRLEQVAGLVADRLERGAGQFRRAAGAGQAEDRAARVRVPVGRPQAGEGGHHVDRLARVGGLGERLGLGRAGDDLELVAQPLHRGAGDEDAALERVAHRAAEPVGDGGEQPVFRGHRLGAGVHQREAAGAVGRLHHAGLEAGLADGGGLLVAGDAADRDRRAEQPGRGRAEFGVAVAHLGQERLGNAEDLQQLRVPGLAMDVEDQGARGVGGVGRVHLAAGQAPQQEAVDGAEGELAGLGPRPRAGHVVEQPGDLGGREVGVDHEPGLGLDRGLQAVGLEPVAVRRRAPVLPDDGVVDRRAGLAVPDDRGFALVGDADPGERAGLEPGLGERAPDDRQGVAPDVLGVVLDPARLRVVLREFPLRLAERPAAPVEQHGAAASGALVDRQNGAGTAHVRCLSRFGFLMATGSWCGRVVQRSRRARAAESPEKRIDSVLEAGSL